MTSKLGGTVTWLNCTIILIRGYHKLDDQIKENYNM